MRFLLLELGRRGQALLFGALALSLAAASSIVGGRWLDPYGWIPSAAAVLVILLCGGAGHRAAWRGFGITRAGFRAWLPALAIPGAVLTAGYLVAAATGNVQLGLGTTTPLFFAGATSAILVLASIESIGVELGWRGFLLPRLADLGRVRAGLLGGLLWAVWHAPLIYLAGAYRPGAGPLYMVTFTITIVAMGFVANELRMASGSSGPAVVFHGAHNGILFQFGVLTVGSTGLLAGIGEESGVVPMTLYGLVAVWIVLRRPAWTPATATLAASAPANLGGAPV
jgi:membrane protease YdiL (CAAX protease family)